VITFQDDRLEGRKTTFESNTVAHTRIAVALFSASIVATLTRAISAFFQTNVFIAGGRDPAPRRPFDAVLREPAFVVTPVSPAIALPRF
jgi:hypothetical protein